MRKRWSILFAFLLGLGFAHEAMALSPYQPEVRTYEEIPYLSGGVGLYEREALCFMSQDYNLKLIFAVAARNYLSNVEIQIRDQGGKTVLEAISQGPWFLRNFHQGPITFTQTRRITLWRRSFRCLQRVKPSSLSLFLAELIPPLPLLPDLFHPLNR